MFSSIFTLFIALLALGFLVFIHELGHYYAARRVGMRVETFSIGFGKPIFSWYRDGVKWQIGWLPFGGFVAIAGTSKEGDVDPYDIPDGFFGKGPWDRIKVAFMGPLVNLVFAFIAFSAIWFLGGREKNFSELTQRAGWVDPQSELYQKGVRPGDVISAYDGHDVKGAKDHLYAAMMSGDEVLVTGFHVDRVTGEQKPFEYNVKTYQHPDSLHSGIMTAGVTKPANYVIYTHLRNGDENPLMEGSPLKGSGLEYGDRIFWMDGEIIVSLHQLSQLLNDNRVLLTVERGDQRLLARVPRVPIQDLKLARLQKDEISDWQYEADLSKEPLNKLWMLPYNLTDACVVEAPYPLLDKEDEEQVFPKYVHSAVQEPLQAGDRILAVDGKPVSDTVALLKELQDRQVHLVVDRGEDYDRSVPLATGESEFNHFVDLGDLEAIAASIGTSTLLSSSGPLHLLKPVKPLRREDFPMSDDKAAELKTRLAEQRKAIEQIPDSEKRAYLLEHFERQQQQVFLGVPAVQDRRVTYNPLPTEAFSQVFAETVRTLRALVTRYLDIEWMSGPVGIVTVIHQQSALGIKEALFWLAFISMNLGMLNLLPIPVLDGGSICLSLFEIFTGKKLQIKTIERLIIPFALGLIALFVYLTYNDIRRIFEMFW